MYTAAIIEDEVDAIENLTYFIKRFCPELELIGHASSVDAGLDLITTHQPDILFLDIKLRNENSFDLIHQLGNIPKIIFITAYAEFALDALKLQAVDYLLKPIQPIELKEAVAKTIQQIDQEALLEKLQQLFQTQQVNKLSIPSKDRLHLTAVHDIIRCQADNNYTIFHLSNGEKIVVAQTLKTYENLLPTALFVRVHQSHIVNLHHIKKLALDPPVVILSTKEEIPVARRRKAHLKKLLQAHVN
ncbi:MAG: LytR/AlgR family response regulator transcription factor [Flammeovirgaceae bacterium]